jgi:hypothetical protein
VNAVKLLAEAGVPQFNKAAVKTIKSAQFPPPPVEVADDHLKFRIEIVFGPPDTASRSEVDRNCAAWRGEIKLQSSLHGVCRGC